MSRRPNKGPDLIIIGGGPAAYAAAIHASAAGAVVAVYDRTPRPVRGPGESLHPGIESMFEQLGCADALRTAGLRRHKGIEVEWGGTRHFERFGGSVEDQWLGFQAPSEVVTAVLRERAQEVGIMLQHDSVITNVVRSADRVVGVAINGSERSAGAVLDATGRSHFLSRRLGLGFEKRSPRLMCSYGWQPVATTGVCPDAELVSDQYGWRYSARMSRDEVAWTRLNIGDVPKSSEPGALARADTTWRRASSVAGPGWFLVGDAAAVLDPSAGRGVLTAMMSAVMAVHCLANSQTRVHAASSYEDWHRTGFESAVAELRDVYANAGLDVRVPDATKTRSYG